MNLKKLVGAAVLLLGFGSLAFAEEEGMYAKLTIGYTHGGVNADWNYYNNSTYNYTLYYAGFEIMPAFGFQLPVFDDKPFSLSLEAQLPITIGGDEDGYWESDTTIVEPAAICFFNWHFGKQFAEPLQKLVPYGGLGFGIPIEHVSYKFKYWNGSKYIKYSDDSTEIGFKMNMTLGARYDFTKQIGALVEWNHGFIGEYSWSFRIGAVYRF